MVANNNLVKLMNIEVDSVRPFEQLVTKTIPSVISLALGPENADSPNKFFGTAFGISLYHKSGPTDAFLTCSHVFNNLASELNESRDSTKFIARFRNERFEWEKVESIKRSDPNLITGDPDDEKLQKLHPQPNILKTVISGELIYPLETLNGHVNADRLALGCVTGHGFSGSPVFSVENGHIVGMHDYAPIEKDIWMRRERAPRCNDSDLYVEYPGGLSFAIPSTRLRQSIDLLETHCYLDQVRKFIR